MSDKDSGPESPPSVTVSAPSMTVCISGESTSHKGNLEWHAPNGSVMDSSSVITTPSDPVVSGKCVSKQLYINDADEKRKRVECLVKIQLANGFNLGTLASKGIKVISKPSKKRQSVKNMERKSKFNGTELGFGGFCGFHLQLSHRGTLDSSRVLLFPYSMHPSRYNYLVIQQNSVANRFNKIFGCFHHQWYSCYVCTDIIRLAWS